ncbi:hypothetical protein BHM03_00044185 [Ensete ventricosum]|nr:hypothetical protein BHM03_00044185 [Ensete ventricosum]
MGRVTVVLRYGFQHSSTSTWHRAVITPPPLSADSNSPSPNPVPLNNSIRRPVLLPRPTPFDPVASSIPPSSLLPSFWNAGGMSSLVVSPPWRGEFADLRVLTAANLVGRPVLGFATVLAANEDVSAGGRGTFPQIEDARQQIRESCHPFWRNFVPPFFLILGRVGIRVIVGFQMLGDEIGKGAYGRVYKGLDLENGDFVAIKQVSLENIPQEDLNIIMVRFLTFIVISWLPKLSI